jgi:hypothetical protein
MNKNDLHLGDDGEFVVDLDVQQKHDYPYNKRKTKLAQEHGKSKRVCVSSRPVVTMLVSLIITVALLYVFVLVAMMVAYIILEVFA